MNLQIERSDLLTGAKFSENGIYRYALWRFWNYQAARDGEARSVMFIMANPSTAEAWRDDPTVRKCAKYARGWGYDGLYIGNLFAHIATHFVPGLLTLEERIGEQTDEWLGIMRNSSVVCIAAWGFMGGNQPERAKTVRAMFPVLYHLGLSKDGLPKHPLYLPANLEPMVWSNEE